MSSNFETVKAKIKLTDVVEEDLNPKKSGKVLKSKCPFHDDKTPSFTIYVHDQTFHCFGCGKGGTVIDYIMYRENIREPYEAVEYMASKYDLVIEGFNAEAIQRKKEAVKTKRSKALKHYENVRKADAFLHERNFKPDTIKHFGIGFSTEQNAITIPFLDTYGNVVGESYRNLDEDKPKYVNDREDEIFKKSELLYGLDKARKHITDKVFLVEGYFDVIAMHQMGYPETVAYCGQSMTEGQANLLSKYIKKHTKIFLIPDNDKTGLKHVATNVKLLKQRIKNPIGVYRFPDGIKDANEVLKLDITIDRFESEHHEMFLLKQELEQCLEQTDEYEVARSFASYTKNKMIRAEMADYLAERWNKSRELVFEYMETEEGTMNQEDDIQDFSAINEKFKIQAREGAAGRMFFNLSQPDMKVKGMKRTEVAYLLGRAGSGKTTFILNFIYNLIFKQSKNIIFNSLELDGANIAPQLLQIHLDKTEEQVTEMVLADDPSLIPFYEKMDKHLRVIDRSGQSIKDIENYIRICNESHFETSTDVAMIDYFGYIKKPGKGDNYHENSELAREIKQLAKRMKCLMFVLTQTNRTGGDGSEPLTMDAARDTGAIEESGDYVFGVYRPAAKAEVTEEDRKANPDFDSEYYLQYLKNRWGGVGKSKLHFDPTTKRITNFDEWKRRIY